MRPVTCAHEWVPQATRRAMFGQAVMAPYAWDCALLVHDRCEPLHRWHSQCSCGEACRREIGEYLFIGRHCDIIGEWCQ